MKRILFAALTAAALFSDGILQSLNAQNMEIPKKVSPFPVGDKLPEQFSKYFVGQAWLAPLTDDKRLNAPVSNVTFSPGCRNNWHSHTGGQLLIAVGGRGYYQKKGRPARALLPGDIVEIAPDVVHWHGAAPDSWFSHLAVACNPATNENTWLEPVDDAQYAAATASVPAPASRLGEDARRRLAELFPGGIPELGDADPELFEIFGNFALGEVTAYGQLDTRTRMLCILASNIASQGRTAYRTTLEGALNAGVTPVEVKETLYQAVPYVGMAKVADFVGITNEVLEARGVTLPLAGQSTTSSADRFEKGLAVQRSIRRGAYRRDARGGPREPEAHPALPVGQLLRRFPDPRRPGREDARAADLLDARLARGLRIAGEGPHRRKCEHRQRQGHPAGRRDPVAALYRLSPHAERHCVPERSFAGKIKK